MSVKDCEDCPLDGTTECEMCEKRVCRVCGCTWNHTCPGGCYWVEKDLCSRCAGKEHRARQRLIYTVDIDEEYTSLEGLFNTLNDTIEAALDCSIVRSRLEADEEVYETGEWEDEE